MLGRKPQGKESGNECSVQGFFDHPRFQEISGLTEAALIETSNRERLLDPLSVQNSLVSLDGVNVGRVETPDTPPWNVTGSDIEKRVEIPWRQQRYLVSSIHKSRSGG